MIFWIKNCGGREDEDKTRQENGQILIIINQNYPFWAYIYVRFTPIEGPKGFVN